MAQYWADLPLWEMLLNEHRDIKTIVEMGAGDGGLTLFLKVQCVARGLQFRSIDRNRPGALDTRLAQTLELPADFVQSDFWKSKRLSRWLINQRLKPLLLFVDGGNKSRELAHFGPMLAPGDYVGVHDYGTEFLPDDISPVSDLLEPIFEQETNGPPHPCITRFWRMKCPGT